MDSYYFECRFARCSHLWAAATCRRNFRTHWQDEADKKITNRIRRVISRVKATR
ncbi:hypothetical protein ACFC08_17725 [Streptomyces sp. NPDC056112]|uniref:hypothetical protein n=1 Tax=Streptomyces sp. NPDC056112 TaxID=3345715 RepID=UPI0035E16969